MFFFNFFIFLLNYEMIYHYRSYLFLFISYLSEVLLSRLFCLFTTYYHSPPLLFLINFTNLIIIITIIIITIIMLRRFHYYCYTVILLSFLS